MSAGLRRSITHWTGGAGRASDLDRKHYHAITEFDGRVVYGKEELEDNIVTSDGDYAAHTLRLNTGSGGFAMAGMAGATEIPFDAGAHPLTEVQFLSHCALLAKFHTEQRLPVTPETCCTHAEVEGLFGVKQRGKWDIVRLPFKPEIRGATAVGNYMREQVRVLMGQNQPANSNRPILRIGDRGVAVAELQSDMAGLGYFSGRTDGHFGPLTRASVLAFQADNDLATDAVVGPMTWRALAMAEPRPLRSVSMEEIDAQSGTAQDARITGRVGDLVGAGGAAGVIAQVQEASATAEAASGVLSRVSQVVTDNWPALLLCGLCLAAWLVLRTVSKTTRERRLRDARTNRSLAR